MTLRKALDSEVEKLIEISKAAFHSDIHVGAPGEGGPPNYDSLEFHTRMQREGHLFTFEVEGTIVGGALLFRDGPILYVGRLFISPEFFRQGLGQRLMEEIEACYPDVQVAKLETPVWNVRTNRFYPKCGYVEVRRDQESVYFEKRLNQSGGERKNAG